MSALHELARTAAAFRGRLRRALLTVGVGRIVLLALLVFALASAVDWSLHLARGVRGGILVLFATGLFLAVLHWLVRPLRRGWTDAEVLAHLDATASDGDAHLRELHELLAPPEAIAEAESETGAALIEAARTRLAERLALVDPRQGLDPRPVRRGAGLLVGAALVLAAAAVLLPEHLPIAAARFFAPWTRTRWPHRTTVAFDEPPNGWTVPQLESFAVRARVSGVVPDHVVLSYRTASGDGWIRETLPVRPAPGTGAVQAATDAPGGFVEYAFPEVREAVELVLVGGDFETDPQTIAIVRRPFLERITGHYAYPGHTGLPPKSVPGGQLSGIEGTRVRVEFAASMPLDKAVLVLHESPAARAASASDGTPAADGSSTKNEGAAPRDAAAKDDAAPSTSPPSNAEHETRIELTRRSEVLFEHEFVLARDARYVVELHETHGYREARPEEYEIRVVPDEPPVVELLEPGRDLVETRAATIDVAFSARDELGLTRVEVAYRIGPAEEHTLGDRITGPLPQTGNESRGRFAWTLGDLADLPESGELAFLVRVQDNNPTGRGRVESVVRRIKVVRPSEFHLEALEQAKLLEEEARIAWRNQLHAWQHGRRWLAEGTGAEDDPAWNELLDAQARSATAAARIRAHLATLQEKADRNRMQRDFMVARLSVVSELLQRLTATEQAPVAAALDRARPRTAAEATSERADQARRAALGEAGPKQRLAVLVLERLVRRLYDWRDLQTSMLTTRLLAEQQQDVLGRTRTLAPRTIAKEIEDLTDADQELLLTLGKQQRVLFESETGLEQQLVYLAYKAERQQRRTIQAPLQTAFAGLRARRVNDRLKRAADLVSDNQPSQVTGDQEAAIRDLRLVEEGLMTAGAQVEPETPFAPDQNPLEESQFDPDLVDPMQLAAKTTSQGSPTETPSATPDAPTELPVLPEGSDPLSAAIRSAIERQDDVLARTKWLDENRGPQEAPRFVRLKRLRLLERQDAALAAVAKAQARIAEQDALVGPVLRRTRADMQTSRDLLAAGSTSAGLRHAQSDVIETLQGLIQTLALDQSVAETTAENRRLGGSDAFGRKYLLAGDDLDGAVALLRRLEFARRDLLETARTLRRCAAHAETEPLFVERIAARRQVAAELHRTVLDTWTRLGSEAAARPAPVGPRLVSTGLGTAPPEGLAPLAEMIAAGRETPADLERLDSFAQHLLTTVANVRDLLEERVRTEPDQPPPPADAPTRRVVERLAELDSPEKLAERLRHDTRLPPEVRARMQRGLERPLDEKYRRLVAAYFAAVLEALESQPPPGPDAPPGTEPKPDGDAPPDTKPTPATTTSGSGEGTR